LLYRWHAYIDGIFAEYKLSLGPYKSEDLDFPGIELQEVAVFSSANDENSLFGKEFTKNALFTHMDFGDVGFYGADINNVSISDKIRIKYKRLNHSPFTYRFKVRNRGRQTLGMVRVFLADEKGTPTTVEMDKFLWNFKTGTTEFERSSDESSSVPRNEQGLYEIQESSAYSGSNNLVDTGIREYTGCGWAKHLLVPRGNPSGFRTNLLVVISPLLPDDDAKTTDWKTVSTLTHSLCGAPGAKFPDSRPMGYPFDRYRGWRDIISGRSNMKRVEITIYHQQDCKRNSDCLRGRTCNLETKRCNVDDVEKPRLPRVTLPSPGPSQNCPFLENSMPKLTSKTLNPIKSTFDCEQTCRKDSKCGHFEWHKLSSRNGRCILYNHVFLESGHPNSIAGMKRCSNTQQLFNGRVCTLKDKKPVVKYVKSWRGVRSAGQCKRKCDGERRCEFWQLRTYGRSSTCHAYEVGFRKSTNSYSGPVECTI